MQKRNLILIIVILGLLLAAILVFYYLSTPKNTTDMGAEDTNFLADFFPFGNKETKTENYSPTDISGYEPQLEEQNGLSLRKISDMPVAGYTVFQKERYKEEIVQEQVPTNLDELTGSISDSLIEPLKPTPPNTETVSALRYVEKATGNVYQTFADKIDQRKITTTLIPKVQEAFFGNQAEAVVLRYLKNDKTIETFAGILPKELLGADTSNTQLQGSFLPTDIKEVTISPDTSKIFYLFNLNNEAIGITANLPNNNTSLVNNKIQVFDSAFTEWLPSWANSKLIALNTKPASAALGYLYAINPEKKDLNKILGGIYGLTSLISPDGKMVLYTNNSLALSMYSIEDNRQISISLKTLPEKCVWAEDSTIVYCAVPKFTAGSQYPDVWYQGEVSFIDEIWKIEAQNGAASLIMDLSTFTENEEIDAIKLSLDSNKKYLFFMNKKDSLLWELYLEQ